MNRPIVALALVLTLSGCAAASTNASQTMAGPPAMSASAMTDVADFDTWAAGLTPASATVTELSSGLMKAEGLLASDNRIWFGTRTALEQDLTRLNSQVLTSPATAAEKVGDIRAIASRIDAAVAHGDTP